MFNGQEVRMRPIILCTETRILSNHCDLAKVCSESKKPILQVHIENYKVKPPIETGAFAQSEPYQ